MLKKLSPQKINKHIFDKKEMKKKMKKKNLLCSAFIIVMIILFSLQSCANKSNINDNKKDSMVGTELVDNILDHIHEWEYISDSFTTQYTYDDVEATGMWLCSANTRGNYYLRIIYTIKTDVSFNSYIERNYQRVYFVTNNEFRYMFGEELSSKDTTLKDTELLSDTYFSKKASKSEKIKNLISDGLKEEEKYFKEITLSNPDTITLNVEQQKLFDNMWAFIKEMEYYEPRRSGYRPLVPLAEIEYYINHTSCEVLLYHGYSGEYGGSYYVSGYSVDDGGWDRLSDAQEDRLENTSKTTVLNWNVKWTEEKKMYALKQSIYNH